MKSSLKRVLFLLLCFSLCLSLTPVTWADGRHAVINTRNITGKGIVEEAKKWIGDYTYWSYSSPWQESLYWRTGYPYNNQVSFDCSGFVGRILNDAGLRGDYSPYGSGNILSEKYGSNYIGISIEALVNYGIDITNEVQRARGGDYSGLCEGDIIAWTNNGRHVIIYAGLVDGTPWMVELWGEYQYGPAHCVYRPVSSSYQSKFETGARYVPKFEARDTIPCDLQATANGTIAVWSMPGKKSTYAESENFASISGTFHVTSIIENLAEEPGHFWYEMKTEDGRTGYVWYENVSSTSQNWTVSASDVKKPDHLNLVGGHSETWDCTGTITTGGSIITEMQGFIYSGANVIGSHITSSDPKYPNSTSCNISDIDSSMRFNDITERGGYTYVVKVKLRSAAIENGACVEKRSSGWVVVDDTRSYYTVDEPGIECTVTYNPNGGACSVSSNSYPPNSNVYNMPPTPTFDGYTFSGWYTEPFGGSAVYQGWIISEDTTLYAHWRKNTVKLTFEAMGTHFPVDIISHQLNGIDIGRGSGYLVLYKNDAENTNQYGVEIAVDALGRVVNYRPYGSTEQLSIPQGGFRLSGHVNGSTDSADFVDEIYTGGYQYVDVDYATGTVTAYKDYVSYLAGTKSGSGYANGEIYGELPVIPDGGMVFRGWYKWMTLEDRVYYSTPISSYILYAAWSNPDNLIPAMKKTVNGHTYQRFDYNVTWTRAASLCESMGGHLVTIADMEEQAVVAELLDESPLGVYYIGATDADEENNWLWVTGEHVTYNNWDSLEPNGGEADNYAAIITKNNPLNSEGSWVDIPDSTYGGVCSISNCGFICEFDPNPWGNLNWTLDEDGLLTISGSGEMDDFRHWSKNAWHACEEDIVSVVIQEGITSIGDWAFYKFENLETITLPSSLTCIGEYAFSGCNNLTSVSIPASVTSIGEEAFSCCRNLVGIQVADENPYYNSTAGVLYSADGSRLIQAPCSLSGSFSIPSGVTSIAMSAFAECSNLTKVIIPVGVTSIEAHAFEECSNLTDFTIPSGVTSIEYCTFAECSSLRSVTIPTSISNIDGSAFMWCNSLTNIYYAGNENQWGEIIIGDDNESLLNATIYYEAVQSYEVTYDANGGTSEPESQTKKHDEALTLTITEPARGNNDTGNFIVTLNANSGSVTPSSLSAAWTTSYSFKNWNTAADGSGTSYAPGATYTANADVILYAQWNSNTTTAAVNLPTPTREGYSFKGWGTSANATEGVTGSYTPSGNVTLYAVWANNPPTIQAGISFDSVNTYPGAEISIPARLVNNPGVIAVEFELSYNSELLEWIGVEPGEYGDALGDYDMVVGQPIAWFASDERTDVSISGVFATLTFRVNENAEDGETVITATVDEDNLFNADFDNVAFRVIPGTVNIKSHMPGDVNGDGKVNNKDYMALRRYIKYKDNEVVEAALDINGDGKVNNKDYMALRRYIKYKDIVIH